MLLKILLPILIVMSLGNYAHTWSHETYGICNFSNKPVGYYEYDNTVLAEADAFNGDPYTDNGVFTQCDDTDMHIYNCQHESCMDSNNQRIYWRGSEYGSNAPAGKHLLAAYWTDDSLDAQPLRAFGLAPTFNNVTLDDTDLNLDHWNWKDSCSECYDKGNKRYIDSSAKDFVIRVGVNGEIDFIHGKDSSACTKLPRPKCEDNGNTPVGSWEKVWSSGFPMNVTVQENVYHSQNVTDRSEWAHVATTSISAGFSFDGFDGGVKTSTSTSERYAHEYSDFLATNKTLNITFNVPAGYLWQWQFKFEDSCGTHVVKKNDVVHSTQGFEKPCCLPDFFKDITNPDGDCMADPKDPEKRIFNNCANNRNYKDIMQYAERRFLAIE